MTLIMNKDSAVLQGAFLQADKLCHPLSLSSIRKADWSGVKHPILQAFGEICGHDEPGDQPNLRALTWKKRIICVLWLKVLSRETDEDVEKGWKENTFFSLQNSLPEVNRVVLLELVKSLSAAPVFAAFLHRLPLHQICAELERLTAHVTEDPTSEDVRFFLNMWWELWKGRDTVTTSKEESIETMFTNQFARLSSTSPSTSPQGAKKLKLDLPPSSSNTDVLHIHLHALQNMKGHVSSTDLCLQALSVCLNALYTSFLIDQEVVLPVEEKLHVLCKVGCTRGHDETLSAELIQEALRDLRASYSPSRFQATRITLSQSLKIIIELAQFWQEKGHLKVDDCSDLYYAAFQLQHSIQRVLAALHEAETPEFMTEKNILTDLLKSLALPAIETRPEVQAQITATIISHRLEDYENFAMLFASQTSWAHYQELWMGCLEKNQEAFCHPSTLISLSSTVMSYLQTEALNLSRCRKVMKITADIFSALSLEDKNKVLTAMLKLSSRGFFSCSVPSAMREGFEKELNMTFNCIIQGGGGAPAASQGNLTTAASLVARVAFQNPEAALRFCCHSAVFNKGAFCLMAKILQQLPGLGERRGGKDEDDGEVLKDECRGVEVGSGLLCRCLQETIRNKSLSVSEKDQLLRFLGLLMTPAVKSEGEEKRQSFLSPQEVVSTFVLPNLSAKGDVTCDAEFSLQLLLTALSVDVEEASPSSHWVMDCSPFPLLYVLLQLYNQTLRCWERPPDGDDHLFSIDTKELLESVLTTLGQVVGAEVAADLSSWSRALFWLYNKVEELDWVVRFHLKPVWGEHFKNEVPSSLLAVCDLPDQDWSGLDLPQYGQGTGLLAWMECCSVSDSLQSTMLSHLSLDQHLPDHVNMFSKGLLVALTQTLPWCSVSQWNRLLRVLKELIVSGRLIVPFSLEYVDYLPLLDLRLFSYELRLSVLLLRAFQLLCGSSCSDWLSAGGWTHVSRLYAQAVREIMSSVKAKLPSPKAPGSRDSNPSVKDPLKDSENSQEVEDLKTEEAADPAPSQEVLFVLGQLFCHVQHIQVMMPGGQSEPLFLCSLEILSHCETIMAAFPNSCSPAESDNIRHFFSTITDNLNNQEMKAVLQQKISQLVSRAA